MELMSVAPGYPGAFGHVFVPGRRFLEGLSPSQVFYICLNSLPVLIFYWIIPVDPSRPSVMVEKSAFAHTF